MQEKGFKHHIFNLNTKEGQSTQTLQFLVSPHKGSRVVDRVLQLIFKVFFWIVCNSQSTLKSPQRSKSTQIWESPFLQRSQHYLYLLYRSARRAGGGNTEGWVEGQSIGWGWKSTWIYCASVCIYVHACLITVIVLERRSIFIWEALMSPTASYLFCLVAYYRPCTHKKKKLAHLQQPTLTEAGWEHHPLWHLFPFCRDAKDMLVPGLWFHLCTRVNYWSSIFWRCYSMSITYV